MHKVALALGKLCKAVVSEPDRWWQVVFNVQRVCKRGVFRMPPISGHPHADILTASDETERNEIAEKKMRSLTEEEQKQLRALQLEYQYAVANQENVPERVPPYGWLMLLSMNSYAERRNYLLYLQVREQNEREKRAPRGLVQPASRASKKSESERPEKSLLESNSSGLLEYGHIYAFVRGPTFKMHFAHRQFVAMQFGLPLVFDFAYQTAMSPSDLQTMVKQLSRAYGFNRKLAYPFNFVCSHLPEGSAQTLVLEKLLQLSADSMPFELLNGSYLDKFDRKDVVYLSPHAETPMRRFERDKVYVLGAVSTRFGDDPVTLQKAKADGVRCECLPLDKYGLWTGARKSLSLDEMVRILAMVAESAQDASETATDDAWRTAFSTQLSRFRPSEARQVSVFAKEVGFTGKHYRQTALVTDRHVNENEVSSFPRGSRFTRRQSDELPFDASSAEQHVTRTIRLREISVFETLAQTGTFYSFNRRYEAMLKRLEES